MHHHSRKSIAHANPVIVQPRSSHTKNSQMRTFPVQSRNYQRLWRQGSTGCPVPRGSELRYPAKQTGTLFWAAGPGGNESECSTEFTWFSCAHMVKWMEKALSQIIRTPPKFSEFWIRKFLPLDFTSPQRCTCCSLIQILLSILVFQIVTANIRCIECNQ